MIRCAHVCDKSGRGWCAGCGGGVRRRERQIKGEEEGDGEAVELNFHSVHCSVAHWIVKN